MDKVQRALERGAGWKGRFIPFEFRTHFGVSPTFGDGTLSLKQGGQTLFRCDRTLSGASLTGPMVDRCRGFRDLVMKAVGMALSSQNLANLRNESVGCSEYIPYVTVPGSDEVKCYFFPEERWDIRQTLLQEKGFMEHDIRTKDQFLATLRRDFLPEGTAVCPRLEMGAVLFDGKNVHSITEGYALSEPFIWTGEQRKYARQADALSDLAGEIRAKVYDSVLKPMVQSGALSRDEAEGLKCGRGYEVRTLDPSLGKSAGVFLWKDSRPVWGAYINSGGRLSISPDGAAYRNYPEPALYHDVELERNFSIDAVREFFTQKVLSPANLEVLTDEALSYVSSRSRVAVPSPSPQVCAQEIGAFENLPARAWLEDERRWVVGEQHGANFEYYEHDDKISIPAPLYTSLYTGMRDSSGERIWEGDVLDCSSQGLGKGYVIEGDPSKGQGDRFYVAFAQLSDGELTSRRDVPLGDFVGEDIKVTASLYQSETEGPAHSRGI